MNPVAALLLSLLCASLLAGCSGGGEETTGPTDPLPPDKGAVTGLLIDDRYRPVPNALLLLTPAALTVTSDALGQFQFVGLTPGPYLLKATAADHEAAPVNIDVQAGQYTEVEVMARRTFSDTGAIVTTEYSVFIPCSVSVPIQTTSVDCTGDTSGDTGRFGFDADYRKYRSNVTYLVTEMLANHKAEQSGALKVVVRDAATQDDPYFASKYTTDGNYLKLVMKYDNVSLDDTENRNVAWKNRHVLETALFAQGMLKAESQSLLDAACPADPAGASCFESRGLGPQVGVKAKFIQTLFIGPPSVAIDTYAVLAPSN